MFSLTRDQVLLFSGYIKDQGMVKIVWELEHNMNELRRRLKLKIVCQKAWEDKGRGMEG